MTQRPSTDGQPLEKAINSTSDVTLVSALRTLAGDIQSGDGIANSVCAEAADRIHRLAEGIGQIRDCVLNERNQLAEAGLDCDQVNAVLGIIDDHDWRIL